MPAAFLSSVKTEEGTYAVLANVTPHYLAVAQNAKREAARKRLELVMADPLATSAAPVASPRR